MKSFRIFLSIAFLLMIFSLGGAEASEAPDFTLRDTEGKYFNISDYEGNDTLVLFFMLPFVSDLPITIPETLFLKASFGVMTLF